MLVANHCALLSAFEPVDPVQSNQIEDKRPGRHHIPSRFVKSLHHALACSAFAQGKEGKCSLWGFVFCHHHPRVGDSRYLGLPAHMLRLVEGCKS